MSARLMLPATLLALLSAAPAAAQSSGAWVISPGLSILSVSSDDGDWGYGPSLAIRRDFGVTPGVARRWGVELTAALPAYGPNNAGGVAADLGPTLTWARPGHELGLAAGLSALLVGDDSELVGGGIGGFASGHATAWLDNALGLFAEVRVRAAGVGGAYLSGSGGISIRL
jgi:hypothetical protein